MSTNDQTPIADQLLNYLAVGRTKGDNSRFKMYPFDGTQLSDPVNGGDAWKSNQGAGAVATTVINGLPYLAVGKTTGGGNRIEIYPFDGKAFGTPITGGSNWGDSRGVTAMAFTTINGQNYLAVGRSKGDNSRVKVYSFDGTFLNEVASTGDSWGSSRETTCVAFGTVGSQTYLAVGRNEGDNSRFKIYSFDGNSLQDVVSDGGTSWGKSRGATGVSFTVLDDVTYLAVGRSKGDNSRIQIYPFDGSSLGTMISGGDGWGKDRGATALEFTQINGVAYLAVGRSKGDNSRFKIFPFNGQELGSESSGGEGWGKTRETTAVSFGTLGGNTYLAVGRNEGANSRFKIYAFNGHFLTSVIENGGDGWGDSRGTSDLQFLS